ncbi:MAG: hypothetical protein JXQ73_21600 [Phycisphaerae bacterium]|nr:hypothetical protein [Phycisphaerae bacterium]
MTCPTIEDWTLLSMDLLDEPRAEEMREHLETCAACRERCHEARRGHAGLLRVYEVMDRDHDAQREQLLASLPVGSPQPVATGWLARGGRRLGGYVMSLNSTTGRRAVAVLVPAACILIAVLVFLSPSQKSAFAAAIEHFKLARTIVCRVTTTIGMRMQLDPEAESSMDPAKLAEFDDRSAKETIRTEKLYMSTEHGVRRDAYEDGVLTGTTYTSEGGPTLVLDHTDHTYLEYDADNVLQQMPEEVRDAVANQPQPDIHFAALTQDPDRLLRGLRALTADADRGLAPDTIDGRDVIGFEIAGEKVGFGPPYTDQAKENRAELWVDAETGVPVRLVFHFVTRISAMTGRQAVPISASLAMTTVYDEFEWDKPLSADWLEPAVPSGYTLHEENPLEQVHMPDEAELIEALRVFSDIAGRYPSSLTAMTASYEFSFVLGSIQARRLAAKQTGRTDEDIPDLDAVGKKLQGIMLYTYLEMMGREPEYFGKAVQPGDADTVLMRWKLEDGSTRIIYGDLRAETVPIAKPSTP